MRPPPEARLDAGTVEILKAHRRRRLEDLRVAGDSWVDTGHVFTTGFGLPISPDTLSQLIAKSIKAYNEPADNAEAPEFPLPHARLHDLRHVHATLLLVAPTGWGTRTPSVTLRVYAHVIRRRAAGIADVFAAAAAQIEENQADEEDGPDPSALAPR
ncbi:hypothetical protein ACFCV3_05915 [Kribbella sp. NPDC056345]|uniref:hypothetical protein n=1 Tax=Kribbella sp. NPDC056345 TaxID=3345789 RepID=UPI0035D80AF7